MKLMVITGHLSTGGSPQYLLEYLKEVKNDYSEVKVIEFTNFSDEYFIQKDKIKNLIGEENVICLGEYSAVNNPEVWYSDKMKLIPIIEEYNPDVIWMNEFPENYEYKKPPSDVMDYVYRTDRTYKIIETTHYNAFDFNDKKYLGDEFMFCSPGHIEQSSGIDIPKYLWEVPMDIKERPDRDRTLETLGLDPSYVHVLNVALFNQNKNQKYIFGIANQLKDKRVMFHFIGNDCFFNDCGISQEHLELPNYKIWGERSDVDTFMSCMDIYLFPSKKELSPITVREALSHQMEVIVNRDNYVSQYTDFDNFYIIDEVDVVRRIEMRLEKFLLVCSFYNKELDQIKRTIDSVLSQTYTNWELIIGDDFSTNDCRVNVIDYINQVNDSRISFYEVKYKYELYLYQNFFKEKDYDYFFDLDSDDIINKELLDIYQRHFVKYPEVNSIFCDYKEVNEQHKLQRYGLVRPSNNLIEDFYIRTDSSYLDIWKDRSSWSMFGCGRCFRRSSYDKFEIVKKCKTATDSMVLFNAMVEGEHLHIPIDLYTYERRVGSDSATPLSAEEHRDYNLNTLNALERYSQTHNKANRIYDDIYLETSAVIMSGFDISQSDSISLMTRVTDEQKEKIEFLYNGAVKVNDFNCQNIVVVVNKIDNIPEFSDRNVSYYEFFDDFNILSEDMERYLASESESSLNNLPTDNYFHYFRHFVSHKNAVPINLTQGNEVIVTDFDGIKLEIIGQNNLNYNIEFIDLDTNKVVYSDKITNNMWVSPNARYYVNWGININGKSVYKQDLSGQRVYVEFGSSSLGDTLAWFPYLRDFKDKHKCELFVMTYKNWLFEGLELYSDFVFMKPGEEFSNIHKKYRIGWHYKDNTDSIDNGLNPRDFKKLPLQQTITDVLGLDHYQLRPSIDMKYSGEPPIANKYVTIAIHSTAQAKYWNYPDGWQYVVDYLTNKGYKVVLVSSEGDGYMGNYHPSGITQIGGSLDEVANYIKHSDFFIGISSGLTWLAWAVGAPMVLISGFTKPYTEFHGEDIERVINESVCNGCFNEHRLNPSDWNWCPLHKGTDRQFECSKGIHPNQVIEGIDKLLLK